MLGVENLNNKTAVNWKFRHCSARASLKIRWIIPHDLIIWWKRQIFVYFIKYYWHLLDIVIQNKKYSVVFHKHGINSLHVYYLISCVIFGLFLSFFMQNWILRYTCNYFFQHVLKFSFYNLRFLKALRT